MGFVFHTIKRVAHQRGHDISIWNHAELAQKACRQSHRQCVREHPAQHTADEHQRITGDCAVANSEFFGQRICYDRAKSERNAGDDLIKREHKWIVHTVKQKLYVKILHVATLEVVSDAADGREDRQDHKILIGKQCTHLLSQRDRIFLFNTNLLGHIFGDTLAGVEIFEEQQRDRDD